MQFFKSIGRKKKAREVTAKDALRLVLQLQEKHQNIEEMEREKGNNLIADIHRNKRHGLHDYQLQLEKLLNQGKKISA